MADRRLLLVHAHPDDESIATGATMAKYAAAGAHVTLVTCTLGEEGEVVGDGLAHLAVGGEDRLGAHRAEELAAACALLGVTDSRLLGGAGRWRDSGMMGVESNERAESFWRADVDTAARDLVAVVRDVRPQITVTYDEDGFYGHPDHIQANRVTVRAVELAADPSYEPELGPPWAVSKLYWLALPKSAIQAGIEAMKDAAESPFEGATSADEVPFGIPDAEVTTCIDAREYLDVKLAALRQHVSQIAADDFFFTLSDNLGQQAWGYEHYRLVRGPRGPGYGEYGWEDDLFAGL